MLPIDWFAKEQILLRAVPIYKSLRNNGRTIRLSRLGVVVVVLDIIKKVIGSRQIVMIF